MKLPLPLCALLALAPLPAGADDVTETLDAARAAYDAGNITEALEELTYAQSLLQAMRTEGLTGFLPAAPAGWTREISTDMGPAMAFTGGGTGAEAAYSNGTERFTITMLADSPMIMAMAPMLSNPMMATAAGGKIHRLDSVKVLEANNALATLVANRFLIQAEGAATDVMLPVMAQIDFDGLAAFNP